MEPFLRPHYFRQLLVTLYIWHFIFVVGTCSKYDSCGQGALERGEEVRIGVSRPLRCSAKICLPRYHYQKARAGTAS